MIEAGKQRKKPAQTKSSCQYNAILIVLTEQTCTLLLPLANESKNLELSVDLYDPNYHIDASWYNNGTLTQPAIMFLSGCGLCSITVAVRRGDRIRAEKCMYLSVSSSAFP